MAIEVISTIKPKNNGTFPIAEAKDITVDENGTRLDAKLTELANNAGSGGSGGGSYVLELTAESGTLTDEQYNAVVANAPNVVAKVFGGEALCNIVAYADGVIYVFQSLSVVDGYEVENCTELSQITVTVNADKTYSVAVDGATLPNKDYVDNAVANAGGSSGGGIIDVTELPTEGIDESALYRVPFGTVYYGKAIQQTQVHIVNGLPATGENVSADMKTIDHTYYNTADGVEYVYLSETLASAMSMTAGWYPASTMYAGVGLAYGGIITELELDIADKIYLLLDYEIYHHKNDDWHKVEKERPQIYVPTSAGEIVSIGDDDYKKIINHWSTLDLYLWNSPLAEKFTLSNRSSTEYVFTRQYIRGSQTDSTGAITYDIALDILKINPYSKTYEFTRALINGASATT